jgi:Fe/S biogenesis protein NfuA
VLGWPGKKKDAPTQPQAAVGPTITFTPAARQQVLEVLAREGGAAAAVLRLGVKNPGAGAPQYDMGVEAHGPTAPDDTLIDLGGFEVVVDNASLPEIDGAIVDFVNDPLRPGFRVDPPRYDVPAGAIGSGLDGSDPLAQDVRVLLDRHINPGIASHGGRAELVGIQDNIVYLALGGGCQGCAMASVTLKQGIEQVIRQALPQVRAVVDATDHTQGANPFYTSSKDAESPFHQAAKA